LANVQQHGKFTIGQEIYTLETLPEGSIWLLDRHPRKGPDGKSLYVKLPNGALWGVDRRRSNCTKSDNQEHRCWIRHGVPPNITVNKDGLTCSAGAGSIDTINWHGFLTDGYLIEI